MFAAKQIFLGRSAKAAPTARSYVQDGLIAMWDGIENAGWGVHDSAATVWKDLTGNGHDFAWYANTAGVSWGDNYLELTNGAKSNIVVAQFSSVLQAQTASGVLAADWVYSDNYANSQTPILTAGNVLNSKANTARDTPRYMIQSIVGGKNYSYTPASGMPTADDWAIVGSCCAGTNTSAATMYNNGNAYAITSGYNASISLSSTILRRTPRANWRIYNYLVYNRALTAEEIAANYAIDKERFNLP